MTVTETADQADGVAFVATATGERAVGLLATSKNGEGIHVHSESPKVAGLAAFNINEGGDSAAIFAEKKGNKGHAGFFVGNVHVTRNLFVEGDVSLANAADFAEDFFVVDAEEIEPGTVMVLCDGETLRPSDKPYDKRVAGVVSGAGEYKSGIVLDKRPDTSDRRPIALLGKVYCKVDANYAPIAVGDLLTTSPSVGYAMKAADPFNAFGAVIGKAMHALPTGKALIPVLANLQ